MNGATRILVVGGHDPSGAGVDADLEALRGLPVEAATVVTAWTDQDASGLRSVGARDAREWKAEALEAVGRGIAAVKFGLLPGEEHVLAARDLVREVRAVDRDLPVVVDPVIRASSGGVFLEAREVELAARELPRADVILTPNLPEAAELTGVPLEELVETIGARRDAAQDLLDAGAQAVIVKGGHGSEDPVHDLVATRAGETVWIMRPRIPGGSIRGSGCRFASRLAAGLALGKSIEVAAEEAGSFVAREIERATALSRRARP